MASSSPAPVVVWFRDDLRLSDHPALTRAVETGAPVLCIYIFDETSADLRPGGGAWRWWLHHSLFSLAKALADVGGRLQLYRGSASTIVPAVIEASGATALFMSRRYGGGERTLDEALTKSLEADGVDVAVSNAGLLRTPDEVRSKQGALFRVFTPFWKASRALGDPAAPLPPPRRIHAADAKGRAAPAEVSIDDLDLLPRKPDWAGGLRQAWSPGEAGARARLRAFLDGGAQGYRTARDRPDQPATSRLSPHLCHGEISPRQVLHAVRRAEHTGEILAADAEKFLSEIGWRDFSYNLLFQFPELAWTNIQPRFDSFPFRTTPGTNVSADLAAWQQGRTGYPIVDAGMRELWTTGYMHNRVRLITASFLAKHLLIDWREGERWFWDTLCDADPASNAANWQWVAGSGADAAPYFRIFNPVLQGERFDPDGAYVRNLVPELGKLPAKWVHRPWEAPADILRAADIVLGQDYPHPAVDHQAARERAMTAFRSLSDGRT